MAGLAQGPPPLRTHRARGSETPPGERDRHWPLDITLNDPERWTLCLSLDKLSVREGHIQDSHPVANVFPVDPGEPEEEQSDHQHLRATL